MFRSFRRRPRRKIPLGWPFPNIVGHLIARRLRFFTRSRYRRWFSLYSRVCSAHGVTPLDGDVACMYAVLFSIAVAWAIALALVYRVHICSTDKFDSLGTSWGKETRPLTGDAGWRRKLQIFSQIMRLRITESSWYNHSTGVLSLPCAKWPQCVRQIGWMS